jgi:DNA-binding CsgD family transcriptional regulator
VTPAPQREQVRLLLEAGHKPREIAERLGISRQRVYQHLNALRQLGWVPPRER